MDRAGDTNTQPPEPFEAGAAPNGTEATGLGDDAAPPPPADASPSLLPWPPARSAARSLEPQVGSLRAAAPERPGRPLAAVGMGAAVLALVAASAVSIARR